MFILRNVKFHFIGPQNVSLNALYVFSNECLSKYLKSFQVVLDLPTESSYTIFHSLFLPTDKTRILKHYNYAW